MIREIIDDPKILRRRSFEALPKDVPVAVDLIDTLLANKNQYDGLAACMIGEHKRILAIVEKSGIQILFNPRILCQSGPYLVIERCKILNREQLVNRFRLTQIVWQDEKREEHVTLFRGDKALLIQHLIDHFDGLLIS